MFLIIQVYEADQEHRTRVMELQDRLTVLEAEASKHQDVLNATVSQHKMQITRLTEDKAMLEVNPPTVFVLFNAQVLLNAHPLITGMSAELFSRQVVK